jgi:hypothetical protein
MKSRLPPYLSNSRIELHANLLEYLSLLMLRPKKRLMNWIKLALYCWFFYVPMAQGFEVSSTFKIFWPNNPEVTQSAERAIFLPSLRAQRFEGKLEGKQEQAPFAVTIIRAVPEISANEYSIKKLWRKELERAKNRAENSKDLGCQKEKEYFYCTRSFESKLVNDPTKKTTHQIFERLYWHRKLNLVTLRVTTSNLATSENILSDAHIEVQSSEISLRNKKSNRKVGGQPDRGAHSP